jgi:hypothetical protein
MGRPELESINDKELATHVVMALQIKDIRDLSEAFETVIISLATILKSTGIRDLPTLIRLTNFAPIRSLILLSEKEFSLIECLVEEKMNILTTQDIFENQIRVARLIDPIQRKRLAAYYTKPVGLKLMTCMVSRYAETWGRPLILADPFLGSGLTLSETVRELPKSNISKIWGIEPHVLSALVAYASIVHSLKGDYEKVSVVVGDAFEIVYGKLSPLLRFAEPLQEILPKADVILTNPPFTRWEILDEDYRIFLMKLIDKTGYGKYVKRRQQNLQLISLFLMDYLLKDDGLLMSVLPASTFYTLYGEAAKDMLKDKYWVHTIVDFSSEPSFSIDSGFKELILIASKTKKDFETAFLTIEDDNVGQLEELSNILKGIKPTNSRINWVNISKIPYPWDLNWLTLFGQNPLRELISKVFAQAAEKGMLTAWADAFTEKQIVRGIEMYGPDFFLIPNKYWRIVGENAEGVVIENYTGMKLRISREFIIPALRKPELYADSIIPKVEHYFLSIPPKNETELPSDVTKYIEWGQISSTAKPALRVFGQYWYSHVNKQIIVKKPFGRVFLPDKIDPSFSKRGVFACYTDQPLTASKNFYIATFNDKLKDKALALWFNSSLFIAYFIVASRKISERWTRFLEEDYLRMPVINVNLLDKYALQEFANGLDKMAERKLEPIAFQLSEDFRLEMDKTLFEIIGIEDSTTLRELYSLLEVVLC